MFGTVLKRISALLLCLVLISASYPLTLFAEEMLLEVDGKTDADNTGNAFIDVCSSGNYGGIALKSDYGSDGLSVALISRKQDKFIIDLNGNTLSLGYLALNMNVEIRGEGTVSVAGGIVIYDGELYLGDGVRLETQSDLAVISHGASARVRVGEGVVFNGAREAEFGIRYEYKDNPIVFEKLPADAVGIDGGVAGKDYFRVLYENCFGDNPSVSVARVAEFFDAADAEAAFNNGFISIVNAFDGTDNDSEDDDSFLKLVGNTVSVGKNGAVLSHANMSLDGSLGVNLYFALSGLESPVEQLGALLYSGVGEGGRIEIPEKNPDGTYKFRIPISPMDMSKTISVRFEGDESGKVWEYSVIKYARYILSDTEGVFGTAVKELIASMLNYGAAMQALSGETENPANAILSEFEEYSDSGKIAAKTAGAIEWLRASGYAYENVFYADAENSPVKFSHLTLAVNEITAIRIYPSDGYPTDGRYSYYLSYQNTTESGAVYEKTERLSTELIAEQGFIQISGVPAGDFHRVFRITVKDNESGETVAYCETTVFNYALGLYERTEAGSAERTLAEALIWYGVRNVTYFSGGTA